MKMFTIPCDFAGQTAPFDVYIGDPKEGNHPLQNQATWLTNERGGTIPPDIMESLAELLELATKNGTSFEDLCSYALNLANDGAEDNSSIPVVANETSQEKLADSQEITINNDEISH